MTTLTERINEAVKNGMPAKQPEWVKRGLVKTKGNRWSAVKDTTPKPQ